MGQEANWQPSNPSRLGTANQHSKAVSNAGRSHRHHRWWRGVAHGVNVTLGCKHLISWHPPHSKPTFWESVLHLTAMTPPARADFGPWHAPSPRRCPDFLQVQGCQGRATGFQAKEPKDNTAGRSACRKAHVSLGAAIPSVAVHVVPGMGDAGLSCFFVDSPCYCKSTVLVQSSS